MRRGFTVIELLVVVAIIGILATITFAILGTARQKANYQSAFSTTKSIQSAANICLSDAVSLCLPGQITAGCGASATGDTQDGGAAYVCTNRPTRYSLLPVGWVWCDATGSSGSCAGAVQTASTLPSGGFSLKAKRPSDGMVITCTETSCTCSGSTSCPTY